MCSKIYYKFLRIFDWIRYDLPYGIRNLFLWFRIIFNDRNFNYSYIYLILQHKLKLMEELIRTNDIHTTAQRDARQIRVCLDLLDHLINDRYEENLYYFHTLKWGESKHEFIPKGDCFTMKITYTNAKTIEDNKQANKESYELFLKVEEFKNKCRKILFKMIGNYINGWWC